MKGGCDDDETSTPTSPEGGDTEAAAAASAAAAATSAAAAATMGQLDALDAEERRLVLEVASNCKRAQALYQKKLDEWVEAKRQKDYKRSDKIRDSLRRQNIDPEVVRSTWNCCESTWGDRICSSSVDICIFLVSVPTCF